MSNQYAHIRGHRELNQDEVDLMNLIKTTGINFSELVAKVQEHPETDKRWVSIGRTHLQEGLMALTRAVARPTFF